MDSGTLSGKHWGVGMKEAILKLNLLRPGMFIKYPNRKEIVEIIQMNGERVEIMHDSGKLETILLSPKKPIKALIPA
jgi:hypothetical protein